ncbi:MAG: hypothetical protein L0Z62_08495 [Gemmataceae bacterium]|nr:hypothetical protein [Gemmataceae bacterium]
MTTPLCRAPAWALLMLLLVQAPPAEGQAPPAKAPERLQFVGRLAPTDPEDPGRPGHRHQVHTCTLRADTGYVMDLVPGPTLGAVLRLEDAAGKPLLGQDAGHPVRRIFFQPTRTATFRLVVSAQSPPHAGEYILLVRQAPKGQQDLPHPGSWVELASTLPVEVGDITIQRHPSPTAPDRGGRPDIPPDIPHGYLEYRFTVGNRSTTDSHEVRLTLTPGREGRGGPHLRRLTRAVVVRPSSSHEVSLGQPNLPFSSSSPGNMLVRVRIEIDGKERAETIPMVVLNRGRHGQFGEPPRGDDPQDILCGPGLADRLRLNLFKAAVGQRGVRFPGRMGVWRGQVRGQWVEYPKGQILHDAPGPVPTWSSSWLAHSGYDGIVASGPEVQAAPPQVQLALWQYVETGGCLMLVGDCKVPESWERRKADVRGLTGYYAGFGLCLLGRGKVEDWEPEHWRLLIEAWEHSARPWRQVRTADRANESFPVVEDVAVPVRGLFLSMVGFVVLAGPLNLYVLSRKGRRIWMLWTVPALGLLACAGVILYMLTTEGLRGHVRTEGLTVLDESAGRASTVGWIGFYAPVVPGDGLHFSASSELTPHLASGRYYRRPQGGGRTLDWTDEQHFASGWLAPRVPAHFVLRKSEARSERLTVRHSNGGSLLVKNGLGAPIRELWLADRKGAVHVAHNVPAGGEAGLVPRGGIEADETRLAWLRDLYAREWLNLPDAARGQGQHSLLPGCYVAILDGTPFIEPGLRDPQSHRATSAVYGIMKEP